MAAGEYYGVAALHGSGGDGGGVGGGGGGGGGGDGADGAGAVLVWGTHARSQTPVPLRGLRAAAAAATAAGVGVGGGAGGGGGGGGARPLRDGRFGRVLSLAAGYQHALARVECNSTKLGQ